MKRLSLPPLKALFAFASAANHLSFSKAADDLCVTAAAVSHHVRLLERQMGVALFQRLPRGLELTPEGKTLHQACEAAFGGLASAVDAVSARDAQGDIRIASVPHYLARVLFPARQSFMARYPRCNLILRHTLDVPEFGEGENDFAILFGKGSWPGLEAELLFNCWTGPACAPALLAREDIRGSEDILRLPVLLDDACFVEIWKDWFIAAGMAGWEKLRFTPCNDIHALLVAAVDGHGMVMEPDFVIADQLASGSLVRPFPAVLAEYGYWLVYPKASLQKKTCRDFRSWLTGGEGIPPAKLQAEPPRMQAKS